MPIYEYECSSCHYLFDTLQKINADPIQNCPKCAQNTAVRLMSSIGFHLKGNGWYVTDFKNKVDPNKKTDNQAKEPPVAATAVSETASTTAATTTTSTQGETH